MYVLEDILDSTCTAPRLVHALVHAADVQRGDGRVLGGRQARGLLCTRQHLLRHRVVDAVVAILDVLLAQLGRRRVGLLSLPGVRLVKSEGQTGAIAPSLDTSCTNRTAVIN